MKRYAREFAFWRGEVKTRPESLPTTFSTASLGSFDIEIDARRWRLRCAAIVVPSGTTLRVDVDGNIVVAYDNTPTAAEKAAVNRCVVAAAE
jgi:hypothetical protein